MHFSYAYHTDVGTTREVNQDALVIKTWNQSGNSVFLGAVCDGLGGLARGEEASRRAAVMLSEWFDRELVQLIAQIGTKEVVERRLRQLLDSINADIYFENRQRGLSGGTTLSMLLFWNDLRFTVHIGDSRIYEITDSGVTLLTHDHSWVMREVDEGRMTPEEAARSGKQNILLQCLGTDPHLTDPLLRTELTDGAPCSYLLCTDGFWHHLSMETLKRFYSPSRIGRTDLNGSLAAITEDLKRAGERDNLTALLLSAS